MGPRIFGHTYVGIVGLRAVLRTGLNADTSSPMGNCKEAQSSRWLTCLLSAACEFSFPPVNMRVANATDEVTGRELDDLKALTKTMLHNLASN
jgi:hypothetical protein